MKKLITTLLALCLTTTASFSDVKLGIIIGFTGTNPVVFLWEKYQVSELTQLA
jgi:hypothetical protein